MHGDGDRHQLSLRLELSQWVPNKMAFTKYAMKGEAIYIQKLPRKWSRRWKFLKLVPLTTLKQSYFDAPGQLGATRRGKGPCHASHTFCILMFLDLETAWVNLLWQWKHLWYALKVSERWVLCWQPGVLHSSTFHPTKNCQRAASWTTNAIIVESWNSHFDFHKERCILDLRKRGLPQDQTFAIVCISPTISYASITIDQAYPT